MSHPVFFNQIIIIVYNVCVCVCMHRNKYEARGRLEREKNNTLTSIEKNSVGRIQQ